MGNRKVNFRLRGISKMLYVISKRDTDYLIKGKKYEIINADMFEYQIEYAPCHYIWIGKDDIKNFEYYV